MERTLKPLICSLFLAALSCTTVRARAEPPSHTFALVIANNRSLDGAQPDLQYADDDGARYQRLFRGLAGQDDVVLLTSFDRATRAQYGAHAPAARPASTAELLTARDRLVGQIAAARERGERTLLYIVYAGHGEMVEGRGQLQLEDRAVDGAFIERELLDTLHADQTHLILDSCNSFFVMNPRKPGGKRWATPRDMAFGFSTRHPEVGLFLSTNSESEVFEWSELESGVFSHEVRSGLSGAADVDGDGSVSYLELAGFVESANRGITRASLRPQLFFRGPRGDRNAALFPVRALQGRRVTLDSAATRLWLKNEQGERLLDLHKDTGPLTVVVPELEPSLLLLYVQTSDAQARTLVREYTLAAGSEPVAMNTLEPRAPELAPRGQHLFGALFSEPFGAQALERYRQESEAQDSEPVYGLTGDDQLRMHGFLRQFAGEGRARRIMKATYALGLGVVAGSASLALASQGRNEDVSKIALSGGVSAGFLTLGLLNALRPSNGERALQAFERELQPGGQRGPRAFVETESWLARMATRERRARRLALWTSQFIAADLVAAGAVWLVRDAHGDADHHDRVLNASLMFSGAALSSAFGVVVGLRESAAERMLALFREDPGIKLHLTVSPTRSGASLGLGGAF